VLPTVHAGGVARAARKRLDFPGTELPGMHARLARGVTQR